MELGRTFLMLAPRKALLHGVRSHFSDAISTQSSLALRYVRLFCSYLHANPSCVELGRVFCCYLHPSRSCMELGRTFLMLAPRKALLHGVRSHFSDAISTQSSLALS